MFNSGSRRVALCRARIGRGHPWWNDGLGAPTVATSALSWPGGGRPAGMTWESGHGGTIRGPIPLG